MTILTDSDPAPFSSKRPGSGDMELTWGYNNTMADFHYLCQRERPSLSNLNNCPEPSLCVPTLLKITVLVFKSGSFASFPLKAHSHQARELLLSLLVFKKACIQFI